MCVCSLSYPACKTHAPYFIVICGLSCSTTFYHVMIITARFCENVNGKCVFWICLQFLCEAFLILRRIQRDTVINVSRSLYIFSTVFRKIIEYQIFRKIRPVGAELFHEDGQTDRHDEANSGFFANMPTNIRWEERPWIILLFSWLWCLTNLLSRCFSFTAWVEWKC